MSTPVKAGSFLSRTRFLSPKSPQFFSTPKSKNVDKSERFLKIPNNFEGFEPVKNNSFQTKINAESSFEASVIIDSPHKSDLLNFGLNKYDLLYTLGKGSFGTVIKGRHKGNLVAVKLIKTEACEVKETNAVNLEHKNIIRIFDTIISQKYGLVIMEYLKNSKNLQSILNETETSFDKHTIIKFSRDIACGLNHCHQNDVLHLDIKPKNILVCDDVCKICDFGNSVKKSGAHNELLNYAGTVAYTAPEIFAVQKASEKSDIYSLGILIWQMITRQHPYKSMNTEVVIYRVVKFDFRPVVDEILDPNLIELCRFCWDKAPDKRPTAAQLYHNLNAF